MPGPPGLYRCILTRPQGPSNFPGFDCLPGPPGSKVSIYRASRTDHPPHHRLVSQSWYVVSSFGTSSQLWFPTIHECPILIQNSICRFISLFLLYLHIPKIDVFIEQDFVWTENNALKLRYIVDLIYLYIHHIHTRDVQ